VTSLLPEALAEGLAEGGSVEAEEGRGFFLVAAGALQGPLVVIALELEEVGLEVETLVGKGVLASR